jgi:hypothetical protein
MLKVGYEENLDQISGKIEGELTHEVAKNYFKEVAEIVKATNCSKILTDVRLAKLSALESEMESLSSELTSIGIVLASRRAILVSEDIKQYKTWENYCFRNGHKSIRLFMDEQAAQDWLVNESSFSLN